MDLVNPTERQVVVGMMITDSKTPLKDGWFDAITINPKSCIRLVRPMYYFPKKINRSDIKRFQIFFPNAAKGDRLFVDNVKLLKKG